MIINIVQNMKSVVSPDALGRLLAHEPRFLIEKHRDLAFVHTLRYACLHSRFYREKFDSLGINPLKVKSPADLGDFYTTPLDIAKQAEDFLCQRPQMVFESSGTSGRNKRIYFSYDELESIGYFAAAGLFSIGLDKKDRCANAFDFCMWIPGMMTQKILERAGVMCMAFGKSDPMEVYKRIPVYNFNVIFGEPTWLIRLTEIAEKNGAYPLKMLISGAEPMPLKARSWMEKIWHPGRVRMGYGTVESGGVLAFELGAHCGHYHLDESNFLFEIAHQKEDGYGEVVFTTLNRLTMPLIRYKNEDISKIVTEKCSCGLSFFRLASLRGRADEMVVCAGGNLYPLMFEDILKDIGWITTDWQIVFKNEGVKEMMEFNLELKSHPQLLSQAPQIKEKILSNMQTQYPDLWKNLSIGIFDVALKYHAPGTLRKARKLIRLLDCRQLET